MQQDIWNLPEHANLYLVQEGRARPGGIRLSLTPMSPRCSWVLSSRNEEHVLMIICAAVGAAAQRSSQVEQMLGIGYQVIGRQRMINAVTHWDLR